MSGNTVSSSQFEPVGPLRLHVENGKGSVEVTALDTTEATVDIAGQDADDVRVELNGEDLVVIAPQQRGGLFGGDRRLDITITVPTRSELTCKLGSSDLTCHGTLGAAQVRTGSGEVTVEQLSGPALLESGSGEITLQHAEEPLRIKSGSGDVTVRHAGAEVSISTGSGEVEVGDCHGNTSVKTGSGDLHVGHAHTSVSLSTGSGDLVIDRVSAGRVQLKGASGDLRVGIPAGIPVWTDITTVSGRVHSTLEGAGQPEPGADYIEVRAKTVSGDVDLRQL
ncbi:DUF4097 family beta strand repeat-containing protein [Nocardioides sp.]|jgi:DUF4097 and DUF4098 domain-containing protein YvlB|uniref:DUF4097 family beta strand repeat-containing protein n=1 Tax=Nocardioides sp. TaxID=35761 RepID=UPI00260F3375|nr:DUF4097 family beta strand repeat-containing protein [Nocardioides sp.]